MTDRLIFPQCLQHGDTVCVLAPAGPASGEFIDAGIAWLSQMGFHVVEGRHLRDRRGYLASEDASRAADLNRAVADRKIRGIFCARGGYGTMRILDALDYDALAADPKPIIGFSDITALSLEIFRRIGLVTFSGPMPAGTQISPMSENDRAHYLRLLTDPDYHGMIPGAGNGLTSGHAQGRLLGGNLTLLVHMAAAGRLPNLDGCVLLIEDVNEAPYRIDRMLTSLRLAGALDRLSGVVAGDMIGAESDQIAEILPDCLPDNSIPIIADFPIGHGERNVAVPLGAQVEIDADSGTVALLEPAVRKRKSS